MSKLLDCPYCEAKGVPVRNDAEVCSPKCRVRKMRAKAKYDSMEKQIEESK
tara:strand:- start:287 stop:439 length:153 start_codon:yes stop_codon:yes gene_type:complete